MRLVLTGASGFVGRHALNAACTAGHEVYVLGRTPPERSDVAFHPCDLMDGPAVRAELAAVRPEGLLHLAWYAVPGRFWTAPDNLDWVAASLLLARSFADCGGRRLVVAGSCAEYDWADPVLDEEATRLRPATLYGQAKAALFGVLQAAAEPLALSFGWGRIFFPYGPGDRPERLIGTLIAAMREGRAAEFSAGTQQRDFIHAADAGSALVALLASAVRGAVNIGSGKAIAVRDFVELASELAGGSAALRFGNHRLAANEPARLVASVNRLEREVGFTPCFNHHTGLRDTLIAAGLIT